jgi:hypothetical protein
MALTPLFIQKIDVGFRSFVKDAFFATTMITPQILYIILYDSVLVTMFLFNYLPLASLFVTLFSGIYPSDFIAYFFFRLFPANCLIQLFTSWVVAIITSPLHHGCTNERKACLFATCDLILLLYVYWMLGKYYLRMLHPSRST